MIVAEIVDKIGQIDRYIAHLNANYREDGMADDIAELLEEYKIMMLQMKVR